MDERDEYVQCPYDPYHMIIRARFQTHLVRCRRNHPSEKKFTCPFNTSHVVNMAESELHVSTCEDRQSFESFKNKDQLVSATKDPPPKMHEIKCEENWDDEEPFKSYNPQVYAQSAAVLRSKQGVTPSERKQFRQEERERFRKLKK